MRTKDDLQALISDKMPGWRLTKLVASPEFTSDERTADMKVDMGPSLEKLHRKFLSPNNAQDAGFGNADVFAAVDDARVTVQIEPDHGGPAKTADIRGGEIKIVQG
jgi:hypothetical protein